MSRPIYLLESPSSDDVLVGRNEGDALARFLSLAGIDAQYFLVTSVEAFDKAWEIILSQMEILPFPTHQNLHISAHGSADGLELTDGDCMEWESLIRRLENGHRRLGPVKFNDEKLPKNLPCISLSMSSCSAFKHFKDAVSPEQPYQTLVGPVEDVGWCEALIAFSTYYYASRSQKGGLKPAVRRMNQAISGAECGKFAIDFNHQTEAFVQTDYAQERLARLSTDESATA